MISVWGLLDPDSEPTDSGSKAGACGCAHVYDATNPEARDIYWDHLPGKLLAQGWDAFCLIARSPKNTGRTWGCHPQQPSTRNRQWR